MDRQVKITVTITEGDVDISYPITNYNEFNRITNMINKILSNVKE